MFIERLCITDLVYKKKIGLFEVHYPIFMGIHGGRFMYAKFASVYDITLKSDNK